MKLIRLKIGKMKDSFRSLYPGFEINFHSLDTLEMISQFNPFCFAGLNGCGKSNVLEALSSIFYHLEFCVASYAPDIFKLHFDRTNSSPNAYILEYLIPTQHLDPNDLKNWYKVLISKDENKEPIMEIIGYPFNDESSKRKISLVSLIKDEPAEGKKYLPDHIVAYSSGGNEILSLPYIKSRLIHYDEYRQNTQDKLREYSEPENSLIYIDNNMSQAVLLSCLIFETKKTLEVITNEVGIVDIHSFRMHINLKKFDFQKGHEDILDILKSNQLDKLKKCATSWYSDTNELLLDFYVTDATKLAFQEHFHNAFELFQLFRLLYELNAFFVSEEIKEDVYMSKGYYTDGKLPTPSPDDDIFHFLDFKISKRIKGSDETKDLLLREFSDGEHQFLHTMGVCLLLKNRRAIILLDEPETHFNPNWRTKFIKILCDSIESVNNQNRNVHLFKDIILTSHSPFIISDCMPDNVILFDRNPDAKFIEAKRAKDLGINTYGASVDFILRNFFNTNLVSTKSLSELRDIIKTGSLDELQNAINKFGESYDKQFLFKRLYEKMKQTKDDSSN